MEKLKEVIDKGIIESHISGDIKDIRRSLSEYGVDLEENDQRKIKLIKQLKFKLKASINETRNSELLQRAVESFQDAIAKGLDKPIAYLNTLIKENRVAVQYKNLDKLDEKEIKEIIKDQNLIEIIELLEGEQ